MKHFSLLLILALVAVSLASPSLAQSEQDMDFHAIFEDRCMSCHGHAGAFVSDTLKVKDGIVVDRGGRPVEGFLRTHKGGLDPKTMKLFLDTFRTQIETGGLFREDCVFCHDRAYEFARLNLILDDDVLVGRYSGHDVAEFLQGHARLTEAEAMLMTDALTALLQGGR